MIQGAGWNVVIRSVHAVPLKDWCPDTELVYLRTVDAPLGDISTEKRMRDLKR